MLKKRIALSSGCFVIFLTAQSLAQEASPSFALPLDCSIGADCFVQNYVDHDTSPAYADFTCGNLSYDGHKGTDIRLIGMLAMRQGYAVRAAADGVVRAVRDGMDDANIRRTGAAAVQGREAGNSVVLTHGNGWETQYAHLRKGSVVVRPGQFVKRGAMLGMVGLSGNTEFPHLHFEVRRDNKIIDPFTGNENMLPCGQPMVTLWDQETGNDLAYNSTSPLKAGFMSGQPSLEAMLETTPANSLPASSKVLTFWVYLLGARQGDVEQMRITAPEGKLLAEINRTVPGNKAVWLSYAGAKNPGITWPLGQYQAEYRLLRKIAGEQAVIVQLRKVISIEE